MFKTILKIVGKLGVVFLVLILLTLLALIVVRFAVKSAVKESETVKVETTINSNTISL